MGPKKLIRLFLNVLLIVSVVGIVFAVNTMTVYNPFTGKFDFVRTINFSGENVTADYFKGDGSLLTGVSGGSNCNVTGSCQSIAYLDYANEGDLNISGNVTSGDFIIPAMKLNNEYSTIGEWINIESSSGSISGGNITIEGTSVKVLEGTGQLRIADDDTSQIKFVHWDNSSLINVSNNSIMYFGVDYNSGNPIVVNYSQSGQFDLDTSFSLGTAINQNGELYVLSNPWLTANGITNTIERFQSFGKLVRDSDRGGLILSYTGTRNPTMSAGKVWSKLNEFEISDIDTTAGDTFDYYYRTATGDYTEKSDQTQWNVTHYDDGSGTLQPITNNWYAVIWVWLNVGAGELALMFPQNIYANSATAEQEEIPTYPTMWYHNGLIIGRIIIKQGTDAPVEVQSSFTETFNAAAASDHGNLAGLADDDHTQYLLASGTRALTGNWNVGAYNITSTDTIDTENLIIRNPPAECSAGYYMTKFNGSTSVCTRALMQTGDDATGNYNISVGNVSVGTGNKFCLDDGACNWSIQFNGSHILIGALKT